LAGTAVPSRRPCSNGAPSWGSAGWSNAVPVSGACGRPCAAPASALAGSSGRHCLTSRWLPCRP